MTNAERYKKYVEEHCRNCKHREEDLCDIKIWEAPDAIITKCNFYEREKGKDND